MTRLVIPTIAASLWLAACGKEESPYGWDSFGYGAQSDGCTGTVGFIEGPAATLDVVCVAGQCDCQVDGTSAVLFEDETFCETWEDAFNGSANKQDDRVAYAVEQCQL